MGKMNDAERAESLAKTKSKSNDISASIEVKPSENINERNQPLCIVTYEQFKEEETDAAETNNFKSTVDLVSSVQSPQI